MTKKEIPFLFYFTPPNRLTFDTHRLRSSEKSVSINRPAKLWIFKSHGRRSNLKIIKMKISTYPNS